MKIIITKIKVRYLNDISMVVDSAIMYWNSSIEATSRNQLKNWAFEALLVRHEVAKNKYENAIVEVCTREGETYVFVY